MFSQVMHKSYTDKEVIAIFIGINMVNRHLSVFATRSQSMVAPRSPKWSSPRSIGFAQYFERPCVHRFPIISIIHSMQNLTSLVCNGSFLMFSCKRSKWTWSPWPHNERSSIERIAYSISYWGNRMHQLITTKSSSPLISIIQFFAKNTYPVPQRIARLLAYSNDSAGHMRWRVYNPIDLWFFAESISFRLIKIALQFYSNHEPNRFNS